jgi:Tfp pilus assembly protein PilF
MTTRLSHRRRRSSALLASALAAGALLAPAIAPAPALAQSQAVSALLDQANYWRLQNRPDQVLRVVERLLAVDPRNAAALAAGVEAHVQLGDRAAAQAMMTRLHQAAPTDPRTAEADMVVRGATVDAGVLAEARRLGQTGRAAEALEQYRVLFRGAAVPDAYAFEYYQTLLGVPQRRQEALDGLARLQQRFPGDRRFALAHAQGLTYAEATRAEGIARLQQLAQSPDSAQSAGAAWRQALLWQPSVPELAPDIETYLQRFPNDTGMQEKLADARASRGAPRDEPGEQRAGGFAHLQAGRLAQAEAAFQAALAANADDPDATGGLGLVRLRQRRTAEARQLLARAMELDPAEGRRKWGSAFAGAAPRGGATPASPEVTQARGLVARQQLAEAEMLLRHALRRELPDRAEAEALLGDISMRQGDPSGAEQHFRSALSRRPDSPSALSGLYGALQSQGRFAEAEEILRRREAAGGALASAAQLRAQALRAEAGRTDDSATAIALLRRALAEEPGNSWVRLDLARQLARQGQAGEARALVQEPIVASRQPSPDQLHAAALFAEEQGRGAEAAQLIERIPQRLRTPDQARLLARGRMLAEVRGATALGNTPMARQRLLALAARPDPGGEAPMAVVRALQAMNDSFGAQEAARLANVANRAAPPQTRIAVAGAMLEAGLEQEAAQAAQELEANARLSPEERRELASLQSGVAVRTADRLGRSGDQAAAYDVLAPALARDPTNPGTNLALARLYQGAREPRQAQEIAEGVLRRNPQNTDARMQAIDSAIALRDWQRAEALLAEGRALMPNDPRIPMLEARLARAWGDQRRAGRALEIAAEQRRAQLGADGGAGGMMAASQATAGNPFRRVSTPDGRGHAVPSQRQGSAGDPMLAEITRQLAEVREETGTRFQPSVGVRARSGDAGLDSLTEATAGVEGSMALSGIGGRLSLQATAVAIDSGDIDDRLPQLRRIGGNPATLPGLSGTITPADAQRAAAYDGRASGLGLALAYARQNFSADVGTTPLGFREQNMVGGVEVAPEIANGMRLRVTAERRAVTDSVLSWAGLRDPASGQNWGGVVRNTLRGQVEFSSSPDTNFYAGGGYSTFTGTGVASNSRVEAGAGVQHMIWRGDEDELSSGLNLTYLAYDKNLRMFTLGHGGYFSPQSYIAATIPLDYRVRSGSLAWRIGGSLGISSFREDRAPVFPKDRALQARLEGLAADDDSVATSYPGQSFSGVGGGLRGDVEYAMTPTLRVGGLLRYDRSADWNEARGMLYARYRFGQ